MKKETYEPSQLHNEVPDPPQPQSSKKVSKNNIVIGVVVGILLIAGVAIWNNPRVQHWGEPRAAKLTVVNEDQFKEKLLEFWRYKYDEEFSILYTENRDSGYCFFYGQATSPSIERRFDFWAGVYEDGSVFCEDEYFAFTIRDEYEAYMADLLREFLPEEFKIYQHYPFNKFTELEKKISFEEFLESYRGEYTGIDFSIYIKESDITLKEMSTRTDLIAAKLLKEGFYGDIFIRSVYDDEFPLISRSYTGKPGVPKNLERILLKVFEDNYEIKLKMED